LSDSIWFIIFMASMIAEYLADFDFGADLDECLGTWGTPQSNTCPTMGDVTVYSSLRGCARRRRVAGMAGASGAA